MELEGVLSTDINIHQCVLMMYNRRILSGFTDPTVVENARYAWKYAASRGITGTPQFIVNGVNVPDAPDGKEQWEDFINKLLASPALDKSELWTKLFTMNVEL